MATQEAPGAGTRRRLILRDSLTFLSLSLLTIALFSLTLFLFNSFTTHRTELGKRWSGRGAAALAQGHPQEAIDALRTALSYAPGERSYELLLAQALASAGHTDEAFNYFSGLWDAQPGSGFINLQLARLAATKKEQTLAINFYRASIYGTWEGDGVARRRDVRLELAKYLLDNRDLSAARAELLVAEGNADNNGTLDLQLGHLFEQSGDRADALEAYLKGTEAAPRDPAPFAAAGRIAFERGDFPTARRLLQQALTLGEAAGAPADFDHSATSALLSKADRILELLPGSRQSSRERVARLLTLRALARHRLESCTAAPNPQLGALTQQWAARAQSDKTAALVRDPERQDSLLELIYATELKANELCGPATGDDALVVTLARAPGRSGKE